MSEFSHELYKIVHNGEGAWLSDVRRENHGSDREAISLIERGATVGQLDLFGDIFVYPVRLRDYQGKEATFELLDAAFYTRFQQ